MGNVTRLSASLVGLSGTLAPLWAVAAVAPQALDVGRVSPIFGSPGCRCELCRNLAPLSAGRLFHLVVCRGSLCPARLLVGGPTRRRVRARALARAHVGLLCSRVVRG